MCVIKDKAEKMDFKVASISVDGIDASKCVFMITKEEKS